MRQPWWGGGWLPPGSGNLNRLALIAFSAKRLCDAGVFLSWVVADGVGTSACCECFGFGLGPMAGGAECLEVVGVVCASLGDVDDVVDFCGGVSACAAGVVVSG